MESRPVFPVHDATPSGPRWLALHLLSDIEHHECHQSAHHTASDTMTPVRVGEHRYRRRVEFAETDMAGVVHFSWYLRYMEEAEHALWRAAGLSIAPAGSEIGYPRVAASVDFHAPLYFEDEFEVYVRIDAISKRSIRYACTITRGETTVATGTVTAVCVRKAPPMRAVDIPDDVLARLTSRSVEGE